MLVERCILAPGAGEGAGNRIPRRHPSGVVQSQDSWRDHMVHPRDFVIYVVVHDDAVRDSIRVLLYSMRFPTCCFNSASEFLRAERPVADSCLILDEDMADMSGSELLDRLRSEGLRIPAIIMAAQVNARVQQAGERIDTIVLAKPCEPDKLIGCLAKALASNQRRT